MVQDEEIKEVPKVEKVNINAAKNNWGDDVDIPIDEPEESKGEEIEAPTDTFVAPTQGTELAFITIKNSLVSGLHCALGEYETSLRLLQKQIALVNPKPLKLAMEHTFLYGKAKFTPIPNSFPSEIQLVNNAKIPIVAIQFELLNAIHKVG